MYHNFKNSPIEIRGVYKYQRCNSCGVERFVSLSVTDSSFKSGAHFNWIVNGIKQRKAPPCNDSLILSQSANKATVTEETKPVEKIVEVEKIVIKGSSISEPEAKLFDSLVIINSLYQDMVRANITTNSVAMAKRFLESSKYKELVKEFNLKQTY